MVDEKSDEYYLAEAKRISDLSPCFRSKCGTIIVKNGHAITHGFNRPPDPQKDCRQIGHCYRDKNDIKSGTELDKCRAYGCHAEGTAIARAAREGVSTNQATMYVWGNTEICNSCRGLITNAGIEMVVYQNKHRDIEKIAPKYHWTIHQLDQNRVYTSWSEVISKKSGTCTICKRDDSKPLHPLKGVGQICVDCMDVFDYVACEWCKKVVNKARAIEYILNRWACSPECEHELETEWT